LNQQLLMRAGADGLGLHQARDLAWPRLSTNGLCRFWIIGGLGAMTVIGYQSIREDNAIMGGINRLV
jgi:hypothetical protein